MSQGSLRNIHFPGDPRSLDQVEQNAIPPAPPEAEAALLHELNARIREVALRAGDDGQAYTFLCECGCWSEVKLPLSDYDGNRPVLAPGHRA